MNEEHLVIYIVLVFAGLCAGGLAMLGFIATFLCAEQRKLSWAMNLGMLTLVLVGLLVLCIFAVEQFGQLGA